jgi:hypothetical protein
LIARHRQKFENALTEDDLEDEDCLEESVNDIRLLAEKYGVNEDIRVERPQYGW